MSAASFIAANGTSSSASQVDAAELALPPSRPDTQEDHDVRMAIAALEIMHSGAGPISHAGSGGAAVAGGSDSVRFPTASVASVPSTAPTTSSTGQSSPVGPASLAASSERGDVQVGEGEARFMARVSQLPLVSGGLEWYERSKASSRVVKVRSPFAHWFRAAARKSLGEQR